MAQNARVVSSPDQCGTYTTLVRTRPPRLEHRTSAVTQRVSDALRGRVLVHELSGPLRLLPEEQVDDAVEQLEPRLRDERRDEIAVDGSQHAVRGPVDDERRD